MNIDTPSAKSRPCTPRFAIAPEVRVELLPKGLKMKRKERDKCIQCESRRAFVVMLGRKELSSDWELVLSDSFMMIWIRLVVGELEAGI